MRYTKRDCSRQVQVFCAFARYWLPPKRLYIAAETCRKSSFVIAFLYVLADDHQTGVKMSLIHVRQERIRAPPPPQVSSHWPATSSYIWLAAFMKGVMSWPWAPR